MDDFVLSTLLRISLSCFTLLIGFTLCVVVLGEGSENNRRHKLRQRPTIVCLFGLHKWKRYIKHEESCSILHRCSLCGAEEYATSYHAMGEPLYTSTNTCDTYKECTRCGEKQNGTRVHNWVIHQPAHNTCKTYKECSRCGEQEKTEIPHQWVLTSTGNEPACSEIISQCSRCGLTKRENGSREHVWRFHETETIETDIGFYITDVSHITRYICVNCGEIKSESDTTRYGRYDI